MFKKKSAWLFAELQQGLADVLPRVVVLRVALEGALEVLNSFLEAAHVRQPGEYSKHKRPEQVQVLKCNV